MLKKKNVRDLRVLLDHTVAKSTQANVETPHEKNRSGKKQANYKHLEGFFSPSLRLKNTDLH